MDDTDELVIDATYVVNMDTAKQRMKHVRQQMAAAGLSFTRFPAVNGRQDGLIEKRVQQGDVHPTSAKLCSPGVLGCALSHLDIWRLCAARDHAIALIVEDDVIFAPRFLHRVRAALKAVPPDFDILMLGFSHANNSATGGLVLPSTRPWKQINEHITIPSFFYGTHCYILSAQGAHKLANAWQVKFQVDIQLATDPRLRVYATTRSIARQLDGDSFVTPMQFPSLCNRILVSREIPGLNLYGLSAIHPMLWAFLFFLLGWHHVYPIAIVALFAYELRLGMSPWLNISALAWLTGLSLPRSL